MIAKILISIPSVWALRNFIYSGFYDKAKVDFDISFLVPENTGIELKLKRLNLNTISYPIISYSRIERILYKVLLIQTLDGKANYQATHFSEDLRKEKFQNRIKDIIINLTARILSRKLIFNLLRKASVDPAFAKMLGEVKKGRFKAILATHIVAKYETKVFFQLQNQGLNLIDFINSFDNTTSRGFTPYVMFDSHMVWNKKMKEELMEIYGIDESKITVTGTPQFDLLSESALVPLEMDDHLHFIVEKGEKYILYCAGHISLLPFEVDLLSSICEKLEQHPKYSNYKVVIRLHPFDDFKRWEGANFNMKGVIFDIPWEQNIDNPYLSVPEKKSFVRHARIINNATLILNIASTSSLDACVVNRPVGNINYGLNKDDKLKIDYYLNSEHFKPIVDSGAVPNFNSTDESFKFLCNGELNNEQYHNLRKDLALTYCGYNKDETATQRIIETIYERIK